MGVGQVEASPGGQVRWEHSGVPICDDVPDLLAKKITAAVLSSGDTELGSLTMMLAHTALDDGSRRHRRLSAS